MPMAAVSSSSLLCATRVTFCSSQPLQNQVVNESNISLPTTRKTSHPGQRACRCRTVLAV